MRSVGRSIVLLVLILAPAAWVAGENALAQEREVVIADACEEPGRIEVEVEVRIGGLDNPGEFVQEPGGVVRDGRGRLFIWFPTHAAYVYDSAGAFLQTLGREGQGPGEYRSLRAIRVSEGDTIHVFDRGNQRWTVLSPELEVVDARRLEAPVGASVVRTGSDWVVNSSVVTEERIGFPLHRLRADGGIAESFGSETPAHRADAPMLGLRALAPAGEGLVWAAPATEYRLELWDVANRRHRSLVRDVSWFRPWVRPPTLSREEPPAPRLTSIHLDHDGVLWVRILRPASDWADLLEEVSPGRFTFREPAFEAFAVLYEAIDPDRACVIARHESDGFMMGAVSDGRFAAYHEDAAGIPFVEIRRVRLER
jgi:hypothetical protein